MKWNLFWRSIHFIKHLHFQDTVNSRFKKDLNLQIHLHKAFFSDNRFLDSYHKSFLNQTTLDLRKEKWSFLNREFTVFKLSYESTSLWTLDRPKEEWIRGAVDWPPKIQTTKLVGPFWLQFSFYLVQILPTLLVI